MSSGTVDKLIIEDTALSQVEGTETPEKDSWIQECSSRLQNEIRNLRGDSWEDIGDQEHFNKRRQAEGTT